MTITQSSRFRIWMPHSLCCSNVQKLQKSNLASYTTARQNNRIGVVLIMATSARLMPSCHAAFAVHDGNRRNIISRKNQLVLWAPRRRCALGMEYGKHARNSRKTLHDFVFCAASRRSVGKAIQQLQQQGLDYDKSREAEKMFAYMLWSENGHCVKVLVGAKGTKYSVRIEVSSGSEDELVLSYGMYRSDSSRLFGPSNAENGTGSMRVPLIRDPEGKHTASLELDGDQAPSYLSFLLHPSSSAVDDVTAGIRTNRKTRFCVPVGLGAGHPMPLGVSSSNDGTVNFSLFSKNAEGVVLCLYDTDTVDPSLEIELDPYVNRTGNIWHVSIENTGNYVSYGYRCRGPLSWETGGRFHMRHVLLDPYAKLLGDYVPDEGEKVSLSKCLGSLENEPHSFDWGDDVLLQLPMEKLIVYRLNVRRFTEHKSSGMPEDVAGTFSGVMQKVQHLKSLGVNAVLFEPIFPFDEQKGPYFPYNFFSPMNSYGNKHDAPSCIYSLKEMIKTLHAHGIEVLLEVVFTHTSEGGDSAPQMISFRGIDNSSYYIVNANEGLLKCYSPVVQQLILDSLRHWAVEFHIDGFCFMNSSFLAQGPYGEQLSRAPLVEAIAFDPVLSKRKIIADCFSPLDTSFVEVQFPHWKRWAEMNTRFYRDVRNYLRGEGFLSDLATRLCGSADLFLSRGPAFSFNYVTRNFGLSLVDLVSFSSSKLTSELSWNCGEEGPTNNKVVLETRLRQIRNFLFILFVSLGIPVLTMGDECGYSTSGSQKLMDRQPMDWSTVGTGFGRQTAQFISFLSSLRVRRNDIFQNKSFLKLENIIWSGSDQSEPQWDEPACKFLALTLKASVTGMLESHNGDLYMCFNASECLETTILPEQPEGTVWLRLVDTSLSYPGFFSNASDPNVDKAVGLSSYEVKPHSCALFESQRITN